MKKTLAISIKALAVVGLLNMLSLNAMQKPTGVTPAPVTVTPAPVVVKPTPVVVLPGATQKKVCTDCSLSKLWNNATVAASLKKAEVSAVWNSLTPKEKTFVLVGGSLVTAAVVYAGYKLYKSLTQPKVKVVVRK